MKIKAFLTILISMAIGFVFGYITSVQIKKHQWENRHKHSYNETFVSKTLDILKPGEGQKDTLLPIIEKYAQKSLQLKNNVSREFDSLVREMNIELKPFISEGQYKSLNSEADKINRRQH